MTPHQARKTKGGGGGWEGGGTHSIDRVLSFLSSRPNWDPPPLPLTSRRVCSPRLVPGGSASRGDRHCGTLGIYVLCGGGGGG
jgi:hypothetical protein